MTKKFHIIALIVLLGFFLMPALTYGCEMESSKCCCDKEMSSSKKDKMDCSKKDNHHKKTDDEGCGGKSKHSSCSCSIFQINNILLSKTEFKGQFVNFFNKKENFYNKETQISSGFSSIWLIPKIS